MRKGRRQDIERWFLKDDIPEPSRTFGLETDASLETAKKVLTFLEGCE